MSASQPAVPGTKAETSTTRDVPFRELSLDSIMRYSSGALANAWVMLQVISLCG